MLVQIYGITTVADAVAVDALGPDSIGLVVDEGIDTWDSVNEATALAIAASIKTARLTALSLSTDPVRISRTAQLLSPAVLHLARAHLMTNQVLDELRATVGLPLMLTVPVTGPESQRIADRLTRSADYLLLDSAHSATGVVGASGQVHDWAQSAAIVAAVSVPVFLAGGLGPHNVEEAVTRVQPAGVDSETATSRDDDRRRKDLAKVNAFVHRARSAK